MNSFMRNCCLSVLLTLAVPAALAEVYRWVDDRGQVHYEDRSRSQRDSGSRSYAPPEGAAEEPRQRMEKTRKLLNAYQVERQQAREQREKQKQAEEKRRRNCVTARDSLRRYQSYGSIYRLDKDGNRVYMDGQERKNLLWKSRDDIARWCD